jgi:hypothetical protein
MTVDVPRLPGNTRGRAENGRYGEARAAIRWGEEGWCLASGSVEYLQRAVKRKEFRAMTLDVLSPCGREPRKFVAVELNGRSWLADIITGSMFHLDTKRCASSDTLQLA